MKELHEEKLLFSFDAYDTGKQFVQDKVIAHHLELDLSFLDENDDSNEGLEEASAIITLVEDTSRPKAPLAARI